MKLSINMKLQKTHDLLENLKQKQFAEFLLEIGNGTYMINSDTEDIINLFLDIVIIKGTDLIDFVYPSLAEIILILING